MRTSELIEYFSSWSPCKPPLSFVKASSTSDKIYCNFTYTFYFWKTAVRYFLPSLRSRSCCKIVRYFFFRYGPCGSQWTVGVTLSQVPQQCPPLLVTGCYSILLSPCWALVDTWANTCFPKFNTTGWRLIFAFHCTVTAWINRKYRQSIFQLLITEAHAVLIKPHTLSFALSLTSGSCTYVSCWQCKWWSWKHRDQQFSEALSSFVTLQCWLIASSIYTTQ
jgi:hypothetical protein